MGEKTMLPCVFLKGRMRELTVSERRDSRVSPQCVAASQRRLFGEHRKAARKQTWPLLYQRFHRDQQSDTPKECFPSHPNCSLETLNLFLRVAEEETVRSLCRRSQPTVYQTKNISGWNGFNLNMCRFGECAERFPRRLLPRLASVASDCEATGD